MKKTIQHYTTIPNHYAGQRIDQVLAILFPDYSRSRLKTWLEKGDIKINQTIWRPKDKVSGSEVVEINTILEDEFSYQAENIELNIIYEDDELLVINKPIGMVVHPAAGNRDKTLLNALLFHAPQLSHLPRAGIVHRLDKDTSGLLVIAKTLKTHHYLVKQLHDRNIKREYEAIVMGGLTGGGKIEAAIGRHPKKRTRMAVIENGKPAVTHYRLIEKFRAHTHIHIELETGRTHQIRVHMAHILHPILGDPTYAGRTKLPKNASPQLIEALQQFKHQALHAKKLTLTHPATQKLMEFLVDPPIDFKNLISILRKDYKEHP